MEYTFTFMSKAFLQQRYFNRESFIQKCWLITTPSSDFADETLLHQDKPYYVSNTVGQHNKKGGVNSIFHTAFEYMLGF